MGLPGGAVVKNPPASTGDMGLILGLGRSPGEGSGNLLQYSCLGNLMDRGAWWAIVHGVAKESDIIYRLNSSNRYRYVENMYLSVFLENIYLSVLFLWRT